MKEAGRQREAFQLPTHPGIVEGLYFSSGPIAALGFFLGGWPCFVLALFGNSVLWFLIASLLLSNMFRMKDDK